MFFSDSERENTSLYVSFRASIGPMFPWWCWTAVYWYGAEAAEKERKQERGSDIFVNLVKTNRCPMTRSSNSDSDLTRTRIWLGKPMNSTVVGQNVWTTVLLFCIKNKLDNLVGLYIEGYCGMTDVRPYFCFVRSLDLVGQMSFHRKNLFVAL